MASPPGQNSRHSSEDAIDPDLRSVSEGPFVNDHLTRQHGTMNHSRQSFSDAGRIPDHVPLTPRLGYPAYGSNAGPPSQFYYGTLDNSRQLNSGRNIVNERSLTFTDAFGLENFMRRIPPSYFQNTTQMNSPGSSVSHITTLQRCVWLIGLVPSRSTNVCRRIH